MAFPITQVAEYYIAPVVTEYVSSASAPTLLQLQEDGGTSPLFWLMVGGAAAGYAYSKYHANAFPGKRGGNQYKIYSLYPFFTEKKYYRN